MYDIFLGFAGLCDSRRKFKNTALFRDIAWNLECQKRGQKINIRSITISHLRFGNLITLLLFKQECFYKKKVLRFKNVKSLIFLEGHKILQNLHQLFDWQYIGQIIGGDFAKFCGVLRI